MEETQQQNQKQLPFLYIHRIPQFRCSFQSRLQSRFQILDPLDDSYIPPSTLHSVRVLLCLGPSPLSSQTLSLLPALECVVVSSVGVDHIDLQECRRRGIVVTNAGDAFSEDAADFAVCLLIDVLRKISAADNYVRRGYWSSRGDFPLANKVGGKKVGIVGLGSIGSLVAKRLQAFNCVISYNSRTQKPSVPYPFYSDVHDLAANNDVLVVCCALTDNTRHIINKDVMKALGKSGVIINIGRGALLDEKELVKSLMKGEIGGAGLDVFEHEPSIPKELFELDNVVLSPHMAVLTPESFAAAEEVVIANLDAFVLKKPLIYSVALE